jgi:hypothetical protein
MSFAYPATRRSWMIPLFFLEKKRRKCHVLDGTE